MSGIIGILQKVGLVAARVSSPAAGHRPAEQPLDEVQVVPVESLSLGELVERTRASAAPALEEKIAAGKGLGAEPDGVFQAAGITPPPHGWTVERISEFVEQKPYCDMDVEMRQRAVLAVLGRDGATTAEVVDHVVRMDTALDTYEAILRRKSRAQRAQLEDEVVALEAKVAELQAEITQKHRLAEHIERSFVEWCERKVARERRWADGLRYLTDQPLVSVGADPNAP